MGLVISYYTSEYEKRICALEKIIGQMHNDITLLSSKMNQIQSQNKTQLDASKASSGHSSFRFNETTVLYDPLKVYQFQTSDKLNSEFVNKLETFETEDDIMKAYGITTQQEMEKLVDDNREYSVEVQYGDSTYHTSFDNKKDFETFRNNFNAWAMKR